MKIEIRSVASKGIPEKERLILDVVSDCDIGDYVLMYTGYDPESDSVTTEISKAVWFPFKPVSEGDLIVVYTKDGSPSEKIVKGGSTAHFFFWGLSKTIWDAKNQAAVLVESRSWTSKGTDSL